MRKRSFIPLIIFLALGSTFLLATQYYFTFYQGGTEIGTGTNRVDCEVCTTTYGSWNANGYSGTFYGSGQASNDTCVFIDQPWFTNGYPLSGTWSGRFACCEGTGFGWWDIDGSSTNGTWTATTIPPN